MRTLNGAQSKGKEMHLCPEVRGGGRGWSGLHHQGDALAVWDAADRINHLLCPTRPIGASHYGTANGKVGRRLRS
jgi:hypothetical protein